MTKIVHVSAECYPIAKVGGLADVVGALPKYQAQENIKSQVIMPNYNNKFTQNNTYTTIYNSKINLREITYDFSIKVLEKGVLDFDVFFVDIPELLFKEYVYSHEDTIRFLAFQIATLDWILTWNNKPTTIHCHDHHTGLIPFMLQESFKYKSLNKVPNILTIHNAQYQGWFSHDYVGLIPEFNFEKVGLLDWGSQINPLASAIKCAWAITTVSPSYMEELKITANGLESLLSSESGKCVGILNGIDANVWNPEKDTYIIENYSVKTIESGRNANKKYICDTYNLDFNKPLFAFIGRLVGEKGADLLPETFKISLKNEGISIFLLGSGNDQTENELLEVKNEYSENYNTFIGYDEKLSHIIYAGADFLLMPSRVEPCGLNQMYALKYGTIPIVRSIGGLKDTVVDIENNGFGICHNEVEIDQMVHAIKRGLSLYTNKTEFNKIRKYIMSIDHSWNASAQKYIDLYNSIK